MPKLWLFDLDDTLFEASGGMLHKIHLLMNEYMCRELGMESLKSSKAPTNYFTPNILRKSWSRLVVSVVHLDALAFPVAAT